MTIDPEPGRMGGDLGGGTFLAFFGPTSLLSWGLLGAILLAPGAARLVGGVGNSPPLFILAAYVPAIHVAGAAIGAVAGRRRDRDHGPAGRHG